MSATDVAIQWKIAGLGTIAIIKEMIRTDQDFNATLSFN